MKPPPPGPVSGLSATHEAKPAATPASTAFPPSARISAPASAVSRCPAAIAPLIEAKRSLVVNGAVTAVRLSAVQRAHSLIREAMLAAGAAATLATLLAWLGPP